MPVGFRRSRDRFHGAFLGLAVGDAVAFPYKTRSRPFLADVGSLLENGYRRHESKFFPIGQYTDDTQTALAVVRATSESGDVHAGVIAEQLISLWRDGSVVDPSPVSSEAVEKLVRGEAIGETSGRRSGCRDGGCLSRGIPVGVWNDDAKVLATDVEACCSVTHSDPLVSAACGGIAAAISYTSRHADILLGDFLDFVAQAAGQFDGKTADTVLDFPRMLSMTEFRALELISRYVMDEPETADRSYWDRIPNNAHFLLFAALYYFLKSPIDFTKTLSSALRAGGEVTTLCSLCGALSGSFLGRTAIPDHLIEELQGSDDIAEQVDAFYYAWESRENAKCRKS